jgi:hypothetical protein
MTNVVHFVQDPMIAGPQTKKPVVAAFDRFDGLSRPSRIYR